MCLDVLFRDLDGQVFESLHLPRLHICFEMSGKRVEQIQNCARIGDRIEGHDFCSQRLKYFVLPPGAGKVRSLAVVTMPAPGKLQGPFAIEMLGAGLKHNVG